VTRTTQIVAASFFFGWITAGAAFADSVTIGSADARQPSGSCVPFGCKDVDRYQQVYAAAFFSGPFDISAFSFLNDFLQSDDSNIDPAFYELRLATTARPVNGLSSDFDANMSGAAQLAFAGPLAGQVADPSGRLTFTLASSFLYNPALGNLLVDVRKTGGVLWGDGGVYIDLNTEQPNATSSIFNFEGQTLSGEGLVTAFEGQAVPPVPEPATIGLVGVGLLAAWRAKQRRIRPRDSRRQRRS
jgi:hypothetical protein